MLNIDNLTKEFKLNPFSAILRYVWRHKSILLWAGIGLFAWYKLSYFLAGNAAVIGPEFITRAATRIFGVAVAAFITLHCDKWVAPIITKWCTKRDGEPLSDFEKAWLTEPSDPRIKLCVMFYLGLFAALLLVFAL